MHVRSWCLVVGVLLFLAPISAEAQSAEPRQAKARAGLAACGRATFEGEVQAGQPFVKVLGNGLKLSLQPIHSGWIVRITPLAGMPGDYDYAQLATPPYQSVSPLSLSTDFAFRAQDAVGWNPRRFRFATSEAAFRALEEAYLAYEHAGTTPAAPLQVRLSEQVSLASEGTITILDARLTPGTADQWMVAASVASHFPTTAHTLVPAADGVATPLGKLLWLRFRVDLDLPRAFRADKAFKVVPRLCGNF